MSILTSEDLNEEFKAKLFALLQEYDVEMQVEEDSSGYGGSMATGINFFSYTKYDDDGNVVQESIDFTIGTWEDGLEKEEK